MGFFSELKEELSQIASEVESEMETFSDSVDTYHEAEKDIDLFVKKFNKMVEVVELNKGIRKDVQKELKDLRKIVLDEISDKKMGKPIFSGSREKMFNKHFASTAPMAVFKIAAVLNDRYNHHNTNDQQWIDLKVKFFEYRALNDEELTELQRLEGKAKSLGADRFVQKAQELQQELLKEEKYLDVIVRDTKPENYKFSLFGGRKKDSNFGDDYYDTKELLIEKMSLYYKEGRTDLLLTYNNLLEDLKGESNRVEKAIMLINKELGKEETLEEKTQAAQALRKNPVREIGEGRGNSFHQRRELGRPSRSAFNER
ncbi:MAG: hypothetical protein PHH93_10220 [Prolixibacteraceae bacterium]|nr:hypothetical protein [Prolixibacteraceae bacterium]